MMGFECLREGDLSQIEVRPCHIPGLRTEYHIRVKGADEYVMHGVGDIGIEYVVNKLREQFPESTIIRGAPLDPEALHG